MKKTLQNSLNILLPLLLLMPFSLLAQLTVTPNQSAISLAQKLVGTGITISNAVLTCATNANGIFSVQTSNLGLDSGIVLTSGHASAVAGPEPGLTSFNNNTAGDPALQQLSGAATTRDACILEFDLVPKGDSVKFEYVFGSEEYINSICGPYNDAFAFFISGPGIVGVKNMAQVPGTNIPVAVNSINSGIPGMYGSMGNCTSMGPGSPFTSMYNNNVGGTTVAYRGLTNVLTAAHVVNPCATYHLKLTIADAVNGLYDSGVFIKAGSLQSTTFSLSASATLSNNGVPVIYKGCAQGAVTFTRSVAQAAPQVLTYQLSGTAVNGVDIVTVPTSITIPANATQFVLPIEALPTIPSGTKDLKMLLMAPFSCNGLIEPIDSVELLVMDAPNVTLLTNDTTICNGTFLNIRTDSSANLTFNWLPTTGLNNSSIANPVANPEVSTTYTLKAFITNSGCDTLFRSVSVDVLATPSALYVGDDIAICSNSPILIIPQIVPDDNTFEHTWIYPYEGAQNSLELSIPNPLVSQSGMYYFTVSSGNCGSLTDSVMINIVEFPLPPVVVSPLKICLNQQVEDLPVIGTDLKWYDTETGGDALQRMPSVNTTKERTAKFFVSQSYGDCESERIPFAIIVERCCDDNIFIPTAFTPNGDGLNDYFELKLSDESRIDRVEVFNRWGQMVFQGTGNRTWNGYFNGAIVDLGNYYYHISFFCKDGTIIYKKGEVTVVK